MFGKAQGVGKNLVGKSNLGVDVSCRGLGLLVRNVVGKKCLN